MRSPRSLFAVLVICCISRVLSAQDTLFFENFDAYPGSKPPGWTTELESAGSKWQFVNGGGTKNPEIQGSRKPPSAYSDTVNALYFYESLGGESVILVTPPIDLEFAVKPELSFMHAQQEGNLGFGLAHDELRIYYKTHFDSAWTEARKIGEYTDEIYDWTEQTILLPEDAYVPECYFAFKATTNYGWGVCIDDVSVIETGIQQRHVDTVIIRQASSDLLPSGTKYNPIIRIDISVKGNTGNVTLNSLDLSSLNTSDGDIEPDGVKLHYNYVNRNFYAASLYDSATFASGEASFSSLSFNLPTGNTYLWVTYDVKAGAFHGNFADAMIPAGSININGSTYPEADASPAGNRLIQESVFFDDFTTDKGWTLDGDFERDRPRGLGGNFIGNPDPMYAAGDTMILGNDLTGLGSNTGDYEPNVSRYGNLATSPAFDLYYYNNVKLNFLRWLNVANNDTASIEMSLDNGSTWAEVWSNNNNVYTDGAWTFFSQKLAGAVRESQVRIRINLGPTTPTDHFSGWNIENFAITGNYVEYDVGPTALLAPGPGCGHTSAETVSIRVKNYGPASTPAKIPVRYSFNGGSDFTEDTLAGPIAFEGQYDFDFSEAVDLSSPGIYNVILETTLDVDEEASNNSWDTVLYVDPTYSLPYFRDFESGRDFWRTGGTNTSFEFGNPAGSIIHTAASGDTAWITNLDGDYFNNEDSYLLGPCFNLRGIDYPVFECKMFFVTENDVDGANLEYSLNNGQTWSRVGNMGDGDTNYWNWYNSDAITALPGGHGWTDITNDWQTARILLDTTVFRNAESVKFRFHFSSDASGRLEGIGIDDIHIYEAPRDLGVVSIEYPVTGCAQDIGDHVAVTVKNFGPDTLMTGDTLILGYDFDSEPTVIDTLVLASNFPKNATMPYTFKKRLTVATSGMKDIKAFTLLPDDIDFYNDTITNDTTGKSIEVKLTPFVFLPEAIYTVRPDTIVLNAYTGEPGNTYLWQDGSTDSAFEVSAMADSVYHVIASNAFCEYRDTTYVYRLIADAGVTDILEPVSDCELGSAVRPRIEVTNFGTDTMHTGDEIPVRYRIDGGTPIEETAVMTGPVYPGSTFEYSFTAPADMSAIKTYAITAYTELAYDDTLANDTLHTSVEVYGITAIDLGPDTVVRALHYTIDAGPGYDTYLWQDGSTGQTLVVDTTGWYRVTVKEGSKCENSDSLLVTIIIPDIAIERIRNPADACGLSATENLDVYVINTGTDTLHSGDTIRVSYRVNAGAVIQDTLFVDRKVEPSDSLLFSSSGTLDMSNPGMYQFAVKAQYDKDLIPGNDSLHQDIEIYGYPDVSLGTDQVVTIKSHVLDAGSGYISYLWQDGSTAQQFLVEYENRRPDSTYSVTVTDENGCEGTDAVKIAFDLMDLRIGPVLSPSSSCLLSSEEELRIYLVNEGTRSVFNEQVKIVASVDKGIPVTGQKTLTQALNPGDSLEFIFGHRFDFSGEGDHTLDAYSVYAGDSDPGNDTISVIISNYGITETGLAGGQDSLEIVSLPYTLDAGADYESYIWNGIAGGRTYQADRYGWHRLEVTNLHGCNGIDSVYLILETGIGRVRLPGRIEVYPVPPGETLHIEYNAPEKDHYTLEIFDARGQKILIREYRQVNNFREAVEVSGMAPGVYYLMLRSGRGRIIKPILIQ